MSTEVSEIHSPPHPAGPAATTQSELPPTASPSESPEVQARDPYQTPQVDLQATPGGQPSSPTFGAASSRAPEHANPFSSPLDEGLAAPLPTDPYAISGRRVDAVAEVGSLRITPRPIDDIFSVTFAVFGERCGVLILACLLMAVAFAVTVIAPVIVLQIIADAGGDAFAGIALLALLPVMIVCSAGISVGLARVAIAVARNSPAPLSHVLPPMGIVIRFLIGAGALAGLLMLAGLIIGGLMGLVSASGNSGLVTFFTVIVFFVGSVLSMAASWLLWSWLFIVSDGKGTAFGSLQAAVGITMHNKTTSLLLLIASMVLSIGGTMMCYVGHLVTMPLTMLMFSVAYLLITDQQVSDPRIGRQSYQNPPAGPLPY